MRFAPCLLWLVYFFAAVLVVAVFAVALASLSFGQSTELTERLIAVEVKSGELSRWITSNEAEIQFGRDWTMQTTEDIAVLATKLDSVQSLLTWMVGILSGLAVLAIGSYFTWVFCLVRKRGGNGAVTK